MLLLIVIIIFKKQLINLLNDVSEISFGNTTIKAARNFQYQLDEEYDFIKDKYNKKYETNLESPPHLGGAGDFGKILYIIDEQKLAHYYKETNSFETIDMLYKEYISSNIRYYNNELFYEQLKENKNTIEYKSYKAITRFYYMTVEAKNSDELWRFEDIVKYQRMIRIIINSHHYNINPTEF